MVRKYLCKLGSSLYDATIKSVTNDTHITLKASTADKSWTQKALDEKALHLFDHGNGVRVTMQDGKVLSFNYSEVEELRALFHLQDFAYKIRSNGKMTTFSKWELK